MKSKRFFEDGLAAVGTLHDLDFVIEGSGAKVGNDGIVIMPGRRVDQGCRGRANVCIGKKGKGEIRSRRSNVRYGGCGAFVSHRSA